MPLKKGSPQGWPEKIPSKPKLKYQYQTKAKISTSIPSPCFYTSLTWIWHFLGRMGGSYLCWLMLFGSHFFLFMSNWPNFLIWWCQCMLLVFFNTIHFLMIQRLRNQGSKSLSSWTYFPYDLEWVREAPKGG